MSGIRFDPAYPLDRLRPADYNPRRITADAFEDLRVSLRTYGVCKPVILNGDGTLVAGHQRTRAMRAEGITHTPAISLGVKVARQDEIRFNLFHNSIETSDSPARFTTPDGPLPLGYLELGWDRVQGEATNATVVRESGKLLAKYGPWGSVVATPDGTIIVNSDYALAARITQHPVLAYVIADEQAAGFIQALSRDYGEYHYAPLDVKAYNQLHCQMARLRGRGGTGRRSRWSSTWSCPAARGTTGTARRGTRSSPPSRNASQRLAAGGSVVPMPALLSYALSEPYQYVWAKAVTGVDLAEHCARSLLGEYVPGIGPRQPSMFDVALPEPEGLLAWYVCGVAKGWRWADNFHLLVLPAEGETAELAHAGMWARVVGGAVEPITAEAIDPAHPKAGVKSYATCRNWQAAWVLRLHGIA